MPPDRTFGQRDASQQRPGLKASRRRAPLPIVLDPRAPEQPYPPCHRRSTSAGDSRRSLALQRVDVSSGETVPADAPVTALDLLDDHPRHRTQALALDLHHRLGQLVDYLALLVRGEYPFDQANIDERHGMLLRLDDLSHAPILVAARYMSGRSAEGLQGPLASGRYR